METTETKRRGVPRSLKEEILKPTVIAAVIQKVCHEIGNPLTSIISLATLLDAKMLTSADQADRLEVYRDSISKEAWRIARLSERLAVLFAPRVRSAGPHDLREIAEKSLQRIRSRMGSDALPVVVESSASDIRVQGDIEQLIVLFVELIENALDALERMSANGKAVTVRIRREGERPVVEVSSPTSSPWKGDFPQLFEPLVTSAVEKKHLGLGLTVAALIAERFGASIAVEETEEPSFVATVRFNVS